MKEQEKTKRLLQFTQRVAYNKSSSSSDDEAEMQMDTPQQKQAPPSRSRHEDGELARLGIRPLDSDRYAQQLVREAGLVPEESAPPPRPNAKVASTEVASRATGAKSAEVIYSASAPGFTRSLGSGAAVDVSDSRAPEKLVLEEGSANAGGSVPDEEDLLTGKNGKTFSESSKQIFSFCFHFPSTVDKALIRCMVKVYSKLDEQDSIKTRLN